MIEYIVDVSKISDDLYDAVEGRITGRVVRCQDCRKADKAGEIFFCKMFGAIVEPWRFCAWGERREDD